MLPETTAHTGGHPGERRPAGPAYGYDRPGPPGDGRAPQVSLDEFFDLSLDMLVVTDTRGHYRRINPAMADLLGRPAEQIENQPAEAFVHPDDWPMVVRHTAEFASGRTRLSFECRMRRPDGSHRWVLWNCSAGGGTGLVYSVGHDITERRAAAQAAAQLVTAVESADDAIVTGDLDRIVRTWNKGAERMFGYTAEEVVGRTLSTAPPERVHEITELMHRVAIGEQVHNFETVRLRKDGTPVEVSLSLSPMRDSAGVVHGMTLIARDVTERNRREREETRAILDIASDPFVGTDANGYIIEWNQRAEQIFGWSREEAVGRTLADTILPESSHSACQTGLYQAAGDGGPVSFIGRRVETTARRHDGTSLPVELSVWRSRESGQQFFHAFIRDISERRHAEREIRQLNEELSRLNYQLHRANDELEKANDHLEHQVRERTAELEQQAAQLRSVNEELESFSYSVSHDLRAPLRAIDGFARILTDECGTEISAEGQGYLGRIRAGAREMGLLIDALLSFSRMQRLELTPQQLDMTALVGQVWDGLAPARQDRNVEFDLAELPTCLGDPQLLRQVWVNLLENALKYSRQADPARIEVRAVPGSQPPIFMIRDNGAGFDMRYADKLYQVFQRLHRADEYEGTGLGLALVHRIVCRHGGRIWAESAPGQGATFYLTLAPDNTSTAA